jgi:hypothetical protein
LIADWYTITQTREHVINENLIRENQKGRPYDYLPQQDSEIPLKNDFLTKAQLS